MYFQSRLSPFPSAHPQQQEINERQIDMIISNMSPASIVDYEAYVSMITAANPQLSVVSRTALFPAIKRRFRDHQALVLAALTDVDVCHVNSYMWTSTADEAFGSFVV